MRNRRAIDAGRHRWSHCTIENLHTFSAEGVAGVLLTCISRLMMHRARVGAYVLIILGTIPLPSATGEEIPRALAGHPPNPKLASTYDIQLPSSPTLSMSRTAASCTHPPPSAVADTADTPRATSTSTTSTTDCEDTSKQGGLRSQ